MTSPHAPLTLNDLLPHGPLRRLGRQVFLCDTVDSTNAFLLGGAPPAGDGAVACAEFQTAGRGRLGRRWEAPRGASILLSVRLHEPADSPALGLGAMLGTLAVCEAVEAALLCSPTIRWPNDIVLNGRKLGGVLAESSPLPPPTANGRGGSSEPWRALVIGIGLNCLQHRGHFPPELAQTATSLDIELHPPVARAPLAAAILTHLDQWLALIHEGAGWPRLQVAWRSHCDDLGARVTLEHDGRRFSGTVLDITAAGDLVVELDRGGRRHFAAATTTRFW